MPEELKYAQYEKGDESEIVDLLSHVFGGWPQFDISCTSLDHWRWKYLDNPVGKQSMVICRDRDMVVGCLLNVPRAMRLNNRVVIAGDACDAAVHPEYRRRGIYSRMIEMQDKIRLEQGNYITCVLQGNPILVEHAKRVGLSSFPAEIKTLVRVHDFTELIKRKNLDERGFFRRPEFLTIGFQGMKTVNLLRHGAAADRVSDASVEKAGRLGENVSTLVESVYRYYNFILDKRPEFLNWRYCDRRGGEYQVDLVLDDGEVKGYCVYRINSLKKDYPEGYILDVLVEHGKTEYASLLIGEAARYFDEHQVNSSYCLLSGGHSLERAFRLNGFIDLFRRRSVVLEALDPRAEDDLDKVRASKAERLEYMFAYTDSI